MDPLHEERVKDMKTGTTRTEVHLQGRVLLVARAVWLGLALLEVILFIFNLLQPLLGGKTFICPFTYTCPYDVPTLSALQYAHISLSAFNIYTTGFGLLTALIFVGLSVLLFWRAFNQPVALLASIAFLLLGAGGLAGDISRMPFTLQVVFDVIPVLVLFFCLGFFLVIFPDGRFVPRWSWLIGCTLFVQAIFFLL